MSRVGMKNYKKYFPLTSEINNSGDLTKRSQMLEEMGKTALTEMALVNPDYAKEIIEDFGGSVGGSLKEGISARALREKIISDGGQFYNALREDLTLTNTQAYITLLEQMIRGDFLAEVDKIMSLTYVNDDLMKSTGGANSLTLNIGEPTEAAVYSGSGDIMYYSEGINKIQISPIKIAAGTRIEWELSKYAQPSFMKWNLRRISNALQRNVAQTILSTLALGSTLPAVTGGVNYDAIIDQYTAIMGSKTANGVPYGFLPDKIVFSPAGYALFLKDSLIKNYVYFSAALNNNKEGTNLAKPIVYFYDMEVIHTPYLEVKVGGKDVQAILVDSAQAAMLVKASDVEVFEGRLPKSVDREVIMAMLFNVAVIFGKAVAVITA